METDNQLLLRLDQQAHERIERAEMRLDRLESELNATMHVVMGRLEQVVTYQKSNEVAITTLNTLIQGSVMLKWVVVCIVGFFSFIGVIATFLEVLTKWGLR